MSFPSVSSFEFMWVNQYLLPKLTVEIIGVFFTVFLRYLGNWSKLENKYHYDILKF